METHSDDLYIFLFIFLTFGIILLAIALAVWQWYRMTNRMKEFAAAHGLNYLPPSIPFLSNPSLSGQVRGFEVNLRMVRRGSGKNSNTFTVLEVKPQQPPGFSFHVYEANFFNTLGKVFGMQDIEINDPEFDRKFIIQSHNENKIHELFTPSIKESFIRYADQYTNWGIRCDGYQLTYEKAGSMGSQAFYDEFVNMLHFLCELGEQLKYIRS